MVGADIELDDPIAGTNRLAINKRVGLLWAYRHLEFSWLCVLRKGNRAEQNCGAYH
jgi:hypothetical protein